MGSCHGLVCFALLNYPYDFVILNPSTGERHTLSNPSKEGKADDKLKGYGFGYDELSDDYKVVRILETRSDRRNGSYIAEIYGVRSKGFFRTIPLPTADWTNCDRKFIGVFVGSSLHWCTRHSGNTVPDHVIHAIDLVSNTYRQQQLPETCFHQAWLLNAGSVDKRLCVSGFLKEEKKIGMWVMEEYWNLESWNRIYCVPYVIDRRVCPMAVTSVGSNVDKILLLVNNEILAWFDPDADETLLEDR